MIIKKLQTSLVSLVILSSLGLQAQNLNVLEKGGNKTPISINAIRSLTFPSGSLKINLKEGTPLSVSLSNVQNINFVTVTNIDSPLELLSEKINIFPNPAKDIATIHFISNDKSDVDLKIISIDGRIVYTKRLDSNETNQHSIDISSWQNGVYGVVLYTGTTIVSGKFIKTN